jgi:hypothetical protein
LRLSDAEEACRDVYGMSSFRKCIFLCDVHKQVTLENRFPGMREGEQMMALIKAEGFLSKSEWSVDTMRRYLQAGADLAQIVRC